MSNFDFLKKDLKQKIVNLQGWWELCPTTTDRSIPCMTCICNISPLLSARYE